MEVKIKLLSEAGKTPTKGTDFSAGYDLYAAENGEIDPLKRCLIKTNISIAIPKGYYGRIAPRSGLAYKNGIDVMAGVIDSDYRGDVGVILYNTGIEVFSFNRGDRIAQLVIEKCYKADWVQVDDLSDTDRGDGGYGHTGKL
jgi:dUTP pyrophosphatase